ncbi:phosphoribosyltransferase family protein [Chelatococcus sp. SYSU_G07232]|uniref:Phosphoribosyltransferase family protein n=1 Tax=Chelatococcus albus TaxID=3047466 RepID=A0ABT7AFA1_9HYPH|nr:phosphoribosyltransferase family protein [Chelatococcus sp. SYSU_G07232]MDJ1158057.1 phosphoribosyltransferase family protein [Chelatococcus sp. SYSU_G07232]
MAARLGRLAGERPVVLALPRGGVPVGYEIARALGAPLDVIFVRKIGVPWQPELALGAVVDGADPQMVIDEVLVRELRVRQDYIRDECARQLAEIERRRVLYHGNRTPVSVKGRTVIVVDDGIATGATMRAALKGLQGAGAARVVIATPVAAQDTLDRLEVEADEIVCLHVPEALMAIGMHYLDFTQVEDGEVIALLEEAHGWERGMPSDGAGSAP